MVANSTDRFNGVVASKAIKVPCDAASTADLVLSGLQTVNSIALGDGDRCLVAAQTNAAENGIYVVRATAWERAADWDGNRDVTQGTVVFVRRALGSQALYQLDTADPITIGVTPISFSILFDPDAPTAADLEAVTTMGSTTTVGVEAIMGARLEVQDGGALRLRDPADTAFVDFSVETDGDWLNIDLTGIGDLGSNGGVRWQATGNQPNRMEINDFGNVLINANRTGGTFVGIGEQTTLRGDTQTGRLTLYGEQGGVIQSGQLVAEGDRLRLNALGTFLQFDATGVAEFNVDSIKLAEVSAAPADEAAYGQVWVRDDAPNVLMFTDDAGTDFQIGGVGAGLGFGLTADQTSSPPNIDEGYLEFATTGTINERQPQMQLSALNTTSVHYFAQCSVAPNGFYLRTRGSASPERHSWGHSAAGTDVDIFEITENLEMFYDSPNTAFGMDEVATVSQIGSVVNAGTTVDAILAWDGSEWIENPTVLADNSSGQAIFKIDSALTISAVNDITVPLMIGDPVSNGNFMSLAANVIQCQAGGAANTLFLNSRGGGVSMGTADASTITLAGAQTYIQSGNLRLQPIVRASALQQDGVLYFDSDDDTIYAYRTTGGGSLYQAIAGDEANFTDAPYLFENNQTSGLPADGSFRFDNAVYGSITEFYVRDDDEVQHDRESMWANLSVGDIVRFHGSSNENSYLIAEVDGAPTDNSGWWTIPISPIYNGPVYPSEDDRFYITAEWLSQVSASVAPPIDLNDNEQIRFGTAQDILMSFDGVNFIVNAAVTGTDFRVDGFSGDLRARSGMGLAVNSTDNLSTSLLVSGGATSADPVQLDTTTRFDMLEDVRVTGAVFATGSAPDTGINEQIAFMDVNASIARFGSFNWSLGTFQPVNLVGSTASVTAQSDGSFNLPGDNTANFTGLGNQLDLFDGLDLVIWDVTDTDNMRIAHNGTAVVITTVNTDEILIAETGTRVRIPSTTDVSLSSTDHPFQIGADTTDNLRMDRNEIIAANNGAADVLGLQAEGGTINCFTNTAGELAVRSGSNLKIESASNGDEVIFDHDDTDFNATFVDTTDWNVTGITRFKLNGVVALQERASAPSDEAAYGQIWVRNDVPNTLVFTDDAGNDIVLASGGSQGGIESDSNTGSTTLTGTGFVGVLNLSLPINSEFMLYVLFEIEAPAADDGKIEFVLNNGTVLSGLVMESETDTNIPIFGNSAAVITNTVVIPTDGGTGQGNGTMVAIVAHVRTGATPFTFSLRAAKNADTGGNGFFRIFSAMQSIVVN